jgi:hypothetical protein
MEDLFDAKGSYIDLSDDIIMDNLDISFQTELTSFSHLVPDMASLLNLDRIII